MTVPIIPGPFQFLAEAGEAAGSIGQIKEERKRHGQEIAHRAIVDLIGQIKDGLKPASVLADKEVQTLMKAAYGVSIPAAVLPQPKEQIQRRQSAAIDATPPNSAAGRVISGVPSERVAQAGESQQVLKGAEAQAALDANVPQLEAAARAAGHQFNRSVYSTALTMFGNDPTFARYAVEAATGVLDARVKMISLNREGYSIERALIAEDARLTSDLLKDADKYWNQTLTTWNNNRQTAPDPEAFEADHPMPNQEATIGEFIQHRTGKTLEEFQQHMQHIWGNIESGGVPDRAQPAPAHAAPAAPAARGAPGGAAPSPSPEQEIATEWAKVDPASAADALELMVQRQGITELQARMVANLFREQQPASWYRRFDKAFKNSLRTKPTSRANRN